MGWPRAFHAQYIRANAVRTSGTDVVDVYTRGLASLSSCVCFMTEKSEYRIVGQMQIIFALLDFASLSYSQAHRLLAESNSRHDSLPKICDTLSMSWIR